MDKKIKVTGEVPCNVERILGPDTNEHVIHYIYPNGKKLSKEALNPYVGGYYKKCRHIYEIVGSPICPDCGKDTHEHNWEEDGKLIRENYTNGNHEKHRCGKCGGTIRGWWDI